MHTNKGLYACTKSNPSLRQWRQRHRYFRYKNGRIITLSHSQCWKQLWWCTPPSRPTSARQRFKKWPKHSPLKLSQWLKHILHTPYIPLISNNCANLFRAPWDHIAIHLILFYIPNLHNDNCSIMIISPACAGAAAAQIVFMMLSELPYRGKQVVLQIQIRTSCVLWIILTFEDVSVPSGIDV